jgi:NAD(P)-dependent dehydrogenase (short-subunit alcohol dehydrogenase family)
MVDRFRSVFNEGLFKDEVMLVTGGGTGIGRCIAHELAHLGAHVILSGRREEPLKTVAEELVSAGGSASIRTLNIREQEQVHEAIGEIVAEHGRLDAVVNNAGGQFASPAAMIRPKGWRAVVDTNLNGTWYVCQAAYAHTMGRSGGRIVNIVAEMWNGFPGMAHTGAARAGVVNLTKTLAIEWAAAGIRINSVAPGTILSGGLHNYPPAIQKAAVRVAKKNPSNRLGTESEVSAAVTYLLSPAAAYITGETLKVDGGSSLAKEPLVPMQEHNKSVPWDGFHLTADLPSLFTDDDDT